MYFVSEDYTTLTAITDPREHGKFFAESNYVIRLKSPKHDFKILWIGAQTPIDRRARIRDAMAELTGGILTMDMTFTTIKKGHEDEGLLSFFPEGFCILDEARTSMDEWYGRVAQNGVMFRIQAPFGGGARAIE